MDLSDLLNKAKEWVGKNPDKADKGIDQGSSMLKKRFAGHDDSIDSATTKAKEYMHRSAPPAQEGSAPAAQEGAAQGGPAQGGPPPSQEQPPPPAPPAAETPPEQRPAGDDQPPR